MRHFHVPILVSVLALASCEVSSVEGLDRTLSGTVLIDGQPLGGVFLEIVSEPTDATYEITTNTDGSFLVGVQRDDMGFSLQAYGDDWRSCAITVFPRLQNDTFDIGRLDFVLDAPGFDAPENLSEESRELAFGAACVIPLWVSTMNSSGGNDQYRHCYSACVAARTCGFTWAVFVSGVKELIDSVCNAGGALANLVGSSCTGWSWQDIQADAKGMQFALNIFRKCSTKCSDEYNQDPCGNGVCDNNETLASCFDDCCVPVNPCGANDCGVVVDNCGGLHNCGACGGCVNDQGCASNDECGVTGGDCSFGVCYCY